MNIKDFWECIYHSSGIEFHFHCKNCQSVPHWEGWAGRGEGKFLRTAGPGIISGASQAGGTWSVKDKILWKWRILPGCFLSLPCVISSWSLLMCCTFTFQFSPSHLRTSQSAQRHRETSCWPGKQAMEAKGWGMHWTMKSLTSGSGSPGR